MTRKAQWVKMSKEMELLDMPGILWHKFEDQRVGAYLAATGAIKDSILDIHGIACFTVETLSRSCPDDLKTRYKLKELNEDPRQVVEDIGRKRGCLRPGGIVDTEKAAELLLRELRGESWGALPYKRSQLLKKSKKPCVIPITPRAIDLRASEI